MRVHVGRRRVGVLLASSSIAALMLGGGASRAFAACTVVTGNTAGFTNPGGHTINCLQVTAATVSGSIVNAGTILPASLVTTRTTVLITNSTIGGGLTNIGTISGLTDIQVGNALNTVTLSGGISNGGLVTGVIGIITSGAGTLTGGITNSSTIASAVLGIQAASFTIFSGGVSNDGVITAHSGRGIQVTGIGTFTGGVINSGTVSTFTTGVLVNGDQSVFGGITNIGTIANRSDGIVVDSVTQFGNSSLGGGITNSGTILVGHDDQAGIEVRLVQSFVGSISNAGTISSGTAGIEIGPSVTFAAGSAIVNSGTITGTTAAIDASQASTAVTIDQVAGLITGDIKLSSHADVLNITGGTINGNIVGQGSSNTVNFAPGSGHTFTYGSGFGFSGINQVNINSGTVILNGVNSATNVDVLGGTLAGTGTIDPAAVTIHAGATFAPGTPGVPGSSMAITGNLVFQPGATYAVSVSPATASFATVSGTATLAGNVAAAFAAGSYLTKQYTILQSGGLSGTFAGLVTTGLPVGFSVALAYNADDVLLDLSGPVVSSGLNTNQANVANAIVGAFNNGAALPPGFVGVLGLSGANQANAFSELDGENSAGFLQGAFQAGNSFLTMMVNPFLDGRFGAGPGFGPATGYAPAERPALPQAAAAFASAMPVKAPAATFDQRFSAWGAAYGGAETIDGNAVVGSHTTTASAAAFAAGIDYRATPDTVLGFALAGGGTSWGLDAGLGGGRSDMFQAGLYGTQRFGNAYLAGALAYNFHDVTTHRTVTLAGIDMLQARFRANGVGARLEGGYRYASPWMGITPYAAAQVQAIALPGYGETATSGSNQFALNFAAQTATTMRGELGAWFDRSTLLGDARLTLYSRLAWAHDFGNTASASAIFQALPGANFIVNGAVPAPDSALVTAGAKYDLANGWSLAAKFDGEFSSTTNIYSGTGMLRKTW
jgi:uncharacterized protein with beta-barrel porin domain